MPVCAESHPEARALRLLWFYACAAAFGILKRTSEIMNDPSGCAGLLERPLPVSWQHAPGPT